MEPNTLEWMTEQRDRLKVECDLANTRCDLLVAEKAAALAAQASAEVERDRLSGANERAATLATSLKAVEAELAARTEQLRQAAALAEKRRLALGDVMQLVAGVTNKVLPLMTEQ